MTVTVRLRSSVPELTTTKSGYVYLLCSTAELTFPFKIDCTQPFYSELERGLEDPAILDAAKSLFDEPDIIMALDSLICSWKVNNTKILPLRYGPQNFFEVTKNMQPKILEVIVSKNKKE